MGGGDNYSSSRYMPSCPFSDIQDSTASGFHESKKPKLSLVDIMVNNLKRVKRLAFGSSKHARQGKTVVDVDCGQCSMDLSSDDSSVEEIQEMDCRRSRDEPGSSSAVLDLTMTNHSPKSDDAGDMLVLGSVYQELFVPLTDEEELEVSYALSDFNTDKVLVTHDDSNIQITGQTLQCLRPCGWLNDEVISLYLELLKEREKREPTRFLKCHFFNALFYDRLTSGEGGYDFKSVRRWTTQQKIGYTLIECDRVFVPIHKKMHWCLGVINKKDEKFQYFDSLKDMDFEVLQNLARYYVDEVKDKNAEDIDVSSWDKECVIDLPTQKNLWDCGMFMIKYADFYSRGLGLYFDQGDMPYFRKRTTKEILRLKAE